MGKIFSFTLILFCLNGFSQQGPGGVGKIDGTSSLKFWTRTDAGVSNTGALIDSITNSAGVSALDIGETGAQRPTLVGAAINGYDEISFSGSNRLRTGVTLTTSNFVTNEASSFVVARADNTTQQSSVYGTDQLVSSTRFSCHLPWRGTVYYDIGECCGASARIQVGSLTGLTSYSLWTYGVNSSTGKELYRNGTLLESVAGTSSYTSHATQRFSLGVNISGSNGFVGDVAEVIVFKEKINTAQRIIVDNYLSAKFGLTLDANNFYNEDDTGAGNFDHNVAGIGQATDGSNHTDSQGTGIIRINTPSALSNDDFLFWGEDVKDADYNFASTLSTNYLERLDTKWRVSKRNDVGTVSVSVKASDLDLTNFNCGNLTLIVSSSSTFATVTSYPLTLSGGVFTATEVSFNDNDYFTLEYKDQIVLDGTTAYNGSGASNKPDTNDDCYKLLVKTNSLPLTEDADVREVEVEDGSKLVVNDGFRIQVTNGINNGGDIRLLGDAQLIQTHTGTSQVTGGGKLYKYIKSNYSTVYQSGYLSSPVSTDGSNYTLSGAFKDGVNTALTATSSVPDAIDFTSTGVLDGDMSTDPIKISGRWLATFNNALDWTREISPTSTVPIGLGVNMKPMGATFTLLGKPNDGDYEVDVTTGRYTLLGNPYPSSIDVDQFISDNSSLFTGTVYLYNGASDATHVRANYTGTYTTLNASGGVPADKKYIGVGQGFFVEANGTGKIKFSNSQRIFNTPTLVAKTNTNVKKSTLRLGFEFDNEDELYHRQVLVAFNNKSFNYENGYDAEMWDKNPSDLYLTVNDKPDVPYVITGVESFNENIEVPISVELDADRRVTFLLDEFVNINTPIFLKDTEENKLYNLKENPVVLDLLEGVYTNRFKIVFNSMRINSSGVLNNEQIIEKDNFNVYYSSIEKSVVIKNPKNIEILEGRFFNLLGKQVGAWDNINSTEDTSLKVSKQSKGLYFVQLKTGNGIYYQKILLK